MRGLRKKSDKILVGMVIGAAVLTCCIHLALYAQFRHGHILTVRQLLKTRFVQYHPRRPAVLSLTGTVWVNMYPSDSFYIELPKQKDPADKPWLTGQSGPEENLSMPQYRESGDTLLITGDFAEPLHRPFVDASYSNHLPQVNIYGRGFRDIRLLDGQLVLWGSERIIGAPAIRLTAVNSTVEVADYDERALISLSKTFFDSLNIHLENSYLMLNRSAFIRAGGIYLDGNSTLNDRWSTTGRLWINGSDSSHIELAGNNLKKATIDIHH
ncbi:MAG TPA: hypothetical protein VNU70_03510 [Puia sp.]|jgi:hypothetical protein|nr:hypothetical protein [Puia sp.]